MNELLKLSNELAIRLIANMLSIGNKIPNVSLENENYIFATSAIAELYEDYGAQGFVFNVNGRMSIKLPETIYNGKRPIFKEGHSLFKIYPKLLSLIPQPSTIQMLDDIDEFRRFSKLNIAFSKK